MKKLKSLSFLTLSLLLITSLSCDNEPLDSDFNSGTDGNNNGNPSGSLVGSWELIEFNNSVQNSVNFNGETIENEVDLDSYYADYILTFAANTFTANGSYSYNTSINVTGQPTITDTYTLEGVSGSGDYSVDGNTMTRTGSFFEFSFDGTDFSELDGEQTADFELSADGQTLTFYQNTTETNNEGGTEVVSTIVGTSTWSKMSTTNTNCDDASNTVTTAETAYNSDTSNTTYCNDYKVALQNKINACGDTNGSIQAIIDDLGDCATINTSTIIGTWELISYTVNGEEDMDTCLGDIEVYTQNTYHYQEVWGDNCENLSDGGEIETYTLTGNQLTIIEEGDPYTYEVLVLNATTLSYQDVYQQNGVTYTDVYTYERQ